LDIAVKSAAHKIPLFCAISPQTAGIRTLFFCPGRPFKAAKLPAPPPGEKESGGIIVSLSAISYTKREAKKGALQNGIILQRAFFCKPEERPARFLLQAADAFLTACSILQRISF
jgi:hypothetical protein